jgi:hypothetical protein
MKKPSPEMINFISDMGRLFFNYVILMSFAFSFGGCKQDFVITADYKEIPVIYGLLSARDSIHYIRIQKIYLDKNTNALIQAQNADSIYYPNILDVNVTELETGRRMKLNRINGDTIGLIKNTGIFANTPNILYRFMDSVRPRYTYHLTIENLETGLVASATTGIVKPFIGLVPNEDYRIYWSDIPNEAITFSWRNAENAALYEMDIEFFYYEVPKGSKDTVLNSLRWNLFLNKFTYNQTPGFVITQTYRTEQFFQYIGSHIENNPKTDKIPVYVKFYLTAGGNILGEYISNQIVKNGFTGAMVSPYYTNIENGAGLFSSRFTLEYTNPLVSETFETLVSGEFTRHIKFK